MILTTEFLYNKFNEFNEEFFDGSLPQIKIIIGKSRKSYGLFHFSIDRTTKVKTPIHISISGYFERSEKEYCQTLIHEMIHYYIAYNLLALDEDAHGKTFQSMMNVINAMQDKYVIRVHSIGDLPENRKLGKDMTFKAIIFTHDGIQKIARVRKTETIESIEESYGHVIKNIVMVTTSSPMVACLPLSINHLHIYDMTPSFEKSLKSA